MLLLGLYEESLRQSLTICAYYLYIFIKWRKAEITIFNGAQFILILNVFVIYLWLITRLAETNQTPFNFAEGESEFVSGFNIEYGRVGFAWIFISKYARIYSISTIFS